MSRFRTLGLIGAVAMAGFISVAAFAQERSSPVRPPSGGLPSGSYQQSCRGANLNGNMLSAQCTNTQGRPVFSTLDTNSCRGRDIYNDNGYLRCGGGGGGPVPPTPPRPVPPTPPQLPSGSYQQSCRGANISGSILRAQCTNAQGRPVSSSLDINGCRGRDIYNENGYLRCNVGGPGGGGNPGGPGNGGGVSPPTGGNYEAILYTQADFRGQSLRVRGPAPNLAFYPGFNDNVRSIRIVRGRAQVCVDSLYRGRCDTIARSVRDLNQIGMGNRISSVR